MPYARAMLRDTFVDAIATNVLALYGLVALGTYAMPKLWVQMMPAQNLRKKYGATWALVTGGSTGIGRSLAEALLDQGLNVAIAALDDEALVETTKALRERHGAKREVRAIAVNLGDRSGGYVDVIARAMGRSRRANLDRAGRSRSRALSERKAPYRRNPRAIARILRVTNGIKINASCA